MTTRGGTMHGLTVRWPSRSNGLSSPGSQLVGSAPVLIEPCEVVAVAEGASGFLAAPSYLS